ncbi:dolichol-phosphate mannosyltransferase subunit 3 [Microthyrium microscopicum]|uniref:Dolichol-phosphate mannosyltransferase subunit 3 n=1 Tax=Microthyrium microscopicum TaxID=703497 RepID=A0A6A6TV82_9PEZI|nr:dolichol-phosphate mannosyltransferase subunit 3 [Microthyrium microscopicum]
MTRASQTIAFLVALVSVWLALFLGYIPTSTKVQDEIVPVLPFWSIVSFGAYLLVKLGYGVLTFNDVPEAHKELMAQIESAREELRSKGVEVD